MAPPTESLITFPNMFSAMALDALNSLISLTEFSWSEPMGFADKDPATPCEYAGSVMALRNCPGTSSPFSRGVRIG